MTEHSYGWPTQPKDEQDLPLLMSHYFIQIGEVVQVRTRSLKLQKQSSGQHRRGSTVDIARRLLDATRRGWRRERSTLWEHNFGSQLARSSFCICYLFDMYIVFDDLCYYLFLKLNSFCPQYVIVKALRKK